jgi:amino acid adenylation domain-containing protein
MKNVEDIYPLSPMQQGMLFHTLLDPEAGDYLTQLTGTIEGRPTLEAFRAAWRTVIRRHALLRTGFVWETLDKPLQVVHREADLPYMQHDWRNRVDQAAAFDVFLVADRKAGFDLAAPPLMRLSIFEIADQVYRFVWTHHHLLLDGWSLPLLMSELFGFAEAALSGRGLSLPHPRPYRDYIGWLAAQDESSAESYWRETLSGFSTPTPIGGAPAHEKRSRSHGEVRRALRHQTSAALGALSRGRRITLNTLVQGAWALLLHRHSAEQDVVFGATVSGRPSDLDGVESMIGLFINTLPVRTTIEAEMNLLPWLESLQSQQTRSRQFEYCRLTSIHGWSDVPRTMPLFESIVVFENYPSGALNAPTGAMGVSDIGVVETTNYPLALIAAPGDEIELSLNYDRSRFDTETVERMADHLITLLEGIAANPERRVSELPMISEAEQRTVIEHWNRTEVPFPADRRLQDLFLDQVTRTPDAVAVAFEDQTLTYSDLNRRADCLALALQHRGVGPETLTGVALDRSPDMIVAILAVLKAGGAWTPIGIDQPAERIRLIVEDACPRLVIRNADSIGRLPQSVQGDVLDIDQLQLSGAGEMQVTSTATASNLAYVIYTSGSAGKPKGVLIEHRGAVNLALAQAKLFGVEAGTRVLQFAAPTFDAAVSEIFVTLLHGGTLVLARREQLIGSDLAKLLCEAEVHVVTLPPSVLATVPETELPCLRTLIVAGEACPAELARRWSSARRMLNAYGPTEATVCATAGECDGQQSITIGRPIDNARVYIVDANLQPAPIGVPGELLIGGAGVARGYLSRPELTAERFITSPFSPDKGQRLYRTGDRARYLADGRIEYLGRIDRQVKIRGFRIEPGEIEAALLELDSVREAVILVRTDDARGDASGHKRLIAYVTPRNGGALRNRELRQALQERLPSYMIPSAFITLDELPLTAHGKIDRAALQALHTPHLETAKSWVAPRNDTEQVLAGIWQEILQVERVGIHENFFDVGGHSLLAMQLASRVRDDLGADLPIAAVFGAPTIAALGQQLLQDPSTRSTVEVAARVVLQTANLSDDELENLVASGLAG